MSSQKVWLRFEKKKKDGSVMKLRIQDLPPERIDEVIDLKLKYFATEEAVHKAAGITSNPASVEGYLEYLNMTLHDPSCRIVICCADADGPQEIMGVSAVSFSKDNSFFDQLILNFQDRLTEEGKKVLAIFHGLSLLFDPVKEYKLSQYYDDRSVLVLPKYRGHGLAEPLLRARRLICAADGVPMTGAWMTAFGTQKAGERDGWETVAEVRYEDLALRYGVTFTDAPPTMKLMVGRPLHED